MSERLDAEDLDVTPDDVLVLKNSGPVGAPGMPEAGYIPIPKKLARKRPRYAGVWVAFFQECQQYCCGQVPA